MPRTIERHIGELCRDDPERADAVVFGRRGLLKAASLAALGGALGNAIPFSGNMQRGLVPALLAQVAAAPAAGRRYLRFPGKDEGLVLLGERPLVAETPESLLDDETTPIEKFFIRNNGGIPARVADGDAWMLRIDGEVDSPLEISVGDLKRRFENVTLRMVLECGGNGRSFFTPAAGGNQWTNGGVGCAGWTGVRLRDVLQAAGLKADARYTANYGADPHLSGDPEKPALSRGVPIGKAMEEHSLLVFAMNGRPLPEIHGYPLRLIIPGWPGSVSQKWLTRIAIRDRIHDGQGMGGFSYRVMRTPIRPGSQGDAANARILESMPVRSIITYPASGAELPAGTRSLALRGAAWDGDRDVREVGISVDYGATWVRAAMQPARNRYDWRRWMARVPLPSHGYFEVWSRATDSEGVSQPHIAGNWNPQGYGANPFHRIAVFVPA
jgi:DMSO/TMAO reductase YedYZ molybdopterin-dependent catalytic subunit